MNGTSLISGREKGGKIRIGQVTLVMKQKTDEVTYLSCVTRREISMMLRCALYLGWYLHISLFPLLTILRVCRPVLLLLSYTMSPGSSPQPHDK